MSLSFQNVVCVRGGRQLFSDVTFALDAGHALVVKGPNGVGKSSLLRIAAGLLTAQSGKVAHTGSIALADEQLALDPVQPLLAALGFWAAIDGGDAAAAIASVGMDHLRDIPVRLLSTGQRRRAIIARVIASGAPIWLLDEPANGLDISGVVMLEGLIAVHRARGGMVVVATHQPIALPDAQSVDLARCA